LKIAGGVLLAPADAGIYRTLLSKCRDCKQT
jgi:hypothetical protein